MLNRTMHRFIGLAIFLLIDIYCIETGLAITCFSCQKISFPRECRHVVHCSDNEKCFSEKISTTDGNTYYNVGCRLKTECHTSTSTGKRSQTTSILNKRTFENITCNECCDSTLCNSNGCGSPALPSRDQRGPLCYNCPYMRDPTSCNRVTVCGRDQMCEIKQLPQTFSKTYATTCGYKSVCDSLFSIGKREDKQIYNKRSSFCFRCCHDDLCNNSCDDPMSTPATSS